MVYKVDIKMKVIVNTQSEFGIHSQSRSLWRQYPLITVIYLLVGQDNSCSAGDVDLREKERHSGRGESGEKSEMTIED